MKKLLAVGMLFTCIFAVNANAGVLKFAGKESKKALKASGHGAVKVLKFAKKVLY